MQRGISFHAVDVVDLQALLIQEYVQHLVYVPLAVALLCLSSKELTASGGRSNMQDSIADPVGSLVEQLSHSLHTLLLSLVGFADVGDDLLEKFGVISTACFEYEFFWRRALEVWVSGM